jgi:hypothetical protein
VPLLATQVACVRFSVPDRPTFGVEKVALLCNPASGGTISSTAIEIKNWIIFFAVAQAKASHILGPGSAKDVEYRMSKVQGINV